MSEQLILPTFPKQTFGASDSLAKTSPLQASKKACKPENEADCFMKLCACLPGFKNKIDPNTFSLKMLKIYLALEEDLISSGCSLKWGGMGTMSNGKCSTQKTSEFHKTGNVCSLLDILEEQVDEKFFLSEEQTARILAQVKNKDL